MEDFFIIIDIKKKSRLIKSKLPFLDFKLSIYLIDKPVNLDIVFASNQVFIAFLVKSMVAALKPFSMSRLSAYFLASASFVLRINSL